MNKKILIIEDEQTLVELLRANLEYKGFNVIAAFNGEDGLKKALDEIPDIVILDVQLPKLDGWEVCKRIKADIETKDIPVIFLTVIPKNEGFEKAKNVGGDFYFTKPFKPAELADIIEKIVDKKIGGDLICREKI